MARSWSRGQLAVLAIQQGRPEHARTVLEDIVRKGVSGMSTATIARTLTAYAWLALADGDPEHATVEAGATSGLHERAGVRMWPSLRQSETELAGRLRDALGADRYEASFAAGTQLNRQQAIGILTRALSSEDRQQARTSGGS